MASPIDDSGIGKTRRSTPFLSLAVQQWLENANERTFELPYCHVLMEQGFTLLHKTTHGPQEQGKDILALNKDRFPCAFQLKSGNIKQKRWNQEVRRQLDNLIEIPIHHPSVPANCAHESYLVVNGEVSEDVRRQVCDLNSRQWKDTQLHLIARGELLQGFLNLANYFTPQKPTDYDAFLELSLADGGNPVDANKYCRFITKVLDLDNQPTAQAELQRRLSVGVLYSCYVLQTFERKENHTSCIQGLVLLLSHILGACEKWGAPAHLADSTISIILNTISRHGEDLERDLAVTGREKGINSRWDGPLMGFRKHLSLSYVLAFKLYQYLADESDWPSVLNTHLWTDFPGDDFRPIGEACLFAFILAHWYQVAGQATAPTTFDVDLLPAGLDLILCFNSDDPRPALVSPYYSSEDALKRWLGLQQFPERDTFFRSSYLLRSFIELLVRYDRRDVLHRAWKQVVKVSMEEFTPEEAWRYYLWRSHKGVNESLLAKKTQSWRVLKGQSLEINLERLPRYLKEHPEWIPLFLVVYPHRIKPDLVKLLDDAITRAKP